MPSINIKYIQNKINTRLELFFDEIEFGRLEFLDSFYTRLHQLKEQGLDEGAIIKQLFNEMIKDEGMVRLENREAETLWGFFKSTSQDTVFSNYEEDKQYTWVMNPGATHCTGCSSRNGTSKTFTEWQTAGLPGDGLTNCHANCMCNLV